LRLWATKVHVTAPTGGTTFYTESEFSQVPLNTLEYGKLVGDCAFFQRNGSGAGVCAPCAVGARAPVTGQ
jgi:hypothetical protein